MLAYVARVAANVPDLVCAALPLCLMTPFFEVKAWGKTYLERTHD